MASNCNGNLPLPCTCASLMKSPALSSSASSKSGSSCKFSFKYATATSVAHNLLSAPNSSAFSNTPAPTIRLSSGEGKNEPLRSRSWNNRSTSSDIVGGLAEAPPGKAVPKRGGVYVGLWGLCWWINLGDGARTIRSGERALGLGDREDVQQEEHDPSRELKVVNVSALLRRGNSFLGTGTLGLRPRKLASSSSKLDSEPMNVPGMLWCGVDVDEVPLSPPKT